MRGESCPEADVVLGYLACAVFERGVLLLYPQKGEPASSSKGRHSVYRLWQLCLKIARKESQCKAALFTVAGNS